MIDFFVPLQCEAKQGDRVRVIRSKSGKTFAAHYTPAKIKHNSAAMASLMAPWIPEKPLEGPLRLTAWFQYPWRKGTSDKKKDAGIMWKDTKPDCDNLFKNLADTMQNCGFFVNDSQLAEVILRKSWGDTPGVEIQLEKLLNSA